MSYKKMKTTAAILGSAAAMVAGGSYFAVRAIFGETFKRWKLEEYSPKLRYKDVEEDFPRRSVSFFSGKNKLQGYVYGEENQKGLVVFSHGILSGHEDYLSGILELVKRGWTVFAFDNTGAAESEGENSRGLVQGPLDLLAALRYVDTDEKLKDRRRFLFGHSQGGYSVCAVLNLYPDEVSEEGGIDGVVSVSGFTTPYAVTTEVGQMNYGNITTVTHPFMKLEYRRMFGEHANLSAVDGINRFQIPILVMHGIGDTFVNYNGAAIINHRDEITNPNVTYESMDYPERNTHNDFFLSLEANRICIDLESKVNEQMKKHGVRKKEALPEEALQECYAGVDRKKASEANQEFFDTVDQFLGNI